MDNKMLVRCEAMLDQRYEALCDQVGTIEEIVDKDPSDWTEEDKILASMVLHNVVAFLLIKRVRRTLDI